MQKWFAGNFDPLVISLARLSSSSHPLWLRFFLFFPSLFVLSFAFFSWVCNPHISFYKPCPFHPAFICLRSSNPYGETSLYPCSLLTSPSTQAKVCISRFSSVFPGTTLSQYSFAVGQTCLLNTCHPIVASVRACTVQYLFLLANAAVYMVTYIVHQICLHCVLLAFQLPEQILLQPLCQCPLDAFRLFFSTLPSLHTWSIFIAWPTFASAAWNTLFTVPYKWVLFKLLHISGSHFSICKIIGDLCMIMYLFLLITFFCFCGVKLLLEGLSLLVVYYWL